MPMLKNSKNNILSITAIVISIGGLLFSYIQTSSVRRQLALTELQARPYVKYMPAFSVNGDNLEVSMHTENLSAIPATVLYTQLTPWVNDKTSGAFMKSPAPDILYAHKGGLAYLQPITGGLAIVILRGEATLMIGSCVIYGSISASDPRRWEIRSLYRYEPCSDLPMTLYTKEIEISSARSTCDSGTIRAEWLQNKK